MIRTQIKVRGVVQGVGFRPFIYRLAQRFGLSGFVRNTTAGVEIQIQGSAAKTDAFIKKLTAEKPPASRIDRLILKRLPVSAIPGFQIKTSRTAAGFTQVSPDIALCPECLKEMNDPRDRRFHYPFINCTNCGPRYSIIEDTPYDRPRTSMKKFTMCPACRREFEDPADRRFHAQPDCCPVCGPQLTLQAINGREIRTKDPISAAAALIKKGQIIAIKGIGGFHIACDATNCRTVARLRKLKNRPTKPLAVMTKEKNLKKIVDAGFAEKKILKSPEAPIVLLKKKKSVISELVAPRNPYLGLMLPYAPVHHLLLEKTPFLVMTSANAADEPLVKDDFELRKKLRKVVSVYLTHNREIVNRNDDSVGFYLPGRGLALVRRSRGFAPAPIPLPFSVPPTLAVGPQLKNTFTLARGREAYVSPHLGDLDHQETLSFFHQLLDCYRRWFKIQPEIIAHDLHPDYLSTRVARGLTGKKIAVQHHEAHIAACLAENGLTGKVIGIAFDGTGYGHDGRIWGGEFFVGGLSGFIRAAHLEYLPLAGGEASIARPYRIALAYGWRLLGREVSLPNPISRQERRAVRSQLASGFQVAYTSSIGRLFDAAAGLLGVMPEITYEAEAAIALEHCCRPGITRSYPYRIEQPARGPMVVRVAEMYQAMLDDRRRLAPDIISARFHQTIVRFSLDICCRLRRMYGMNRVCLSGGVFQNRRLLNLMIDYLERKKFTVFTHRRLPTNDGCISYGQVVLANPVPAGRLRAGLNR